MAVRKKVDPLTAAHDKVTAALDVFNVARRGLTEAITHYESVEAAAEAAIDAAQARLAEAASAKANSANVLSKIDGLLA